MTITVVSAGSSASVSLPASGSVTFLCTTGTATVLVSLANGDSQSIQRNGPFSFACGPYSSLATIQVTCTAGEVRFESPSGATVTDNSLDSAEVLSLISFGVIQGAPVDNDALAPVIQRVNSLPSNADLADRSKHTGFAPAANVRMTDGTTVEDAIQQLRLGQGQQASAPSITTAPTFDDTTPAVDQTLTITPGSVTEASGRTSTASYRINIPGQPEGSFSSSTSYKVPAVAFGLGISVTQRQTDDVIPTLYSERTSAVTTAVSATAPTNSLAPSWSATTADTGTAVTLNMNTWSNANSWVITLKDNGVPFGNTITLTSPTTTTTYTPVVGQEGHAITADVQAYSSLGVPAASVVSTSNTLTVNGAADVTWTVDPALASTMYIDQANVGTAGTVTGAAINSTRNYSFLFVRGGVETYFRTGNTVPTITPETVYNLPSTASCQVGDTIYMEEIVTITATGQTRTKRSAGKTLQAAPVAFAVNLTAAGSAGYSWTVNQAITQTTVATASGGTAPYAITANTLPAGVTASVSGSNIVLSGTPTAQAGSSTGSVTVGDSGGATPIAKTFTYQVNPASVTALAASPFPVPLDLAPLGSQTYSGSGTVTIANLDRVVSQTSGLYIHRVKRSDAAISGTSGTTLVRNEFVHIDQGSANYFFPGDDLWMAFAWKGISGEWPTVFNHGQADDEFLVMQTHSESSGATAPDFAVAIRAQSGLLRFNTSWSAQASGPSQTADGENNQYSMAIPAPGVLHKVIVHLKPGYLVSHNPLTEIWLSVSNGAFSKLTLSAPNARNTYNNPTGSYGRIGLYRWEGYWPSSLTTVGIEASRLYFEKTTGSYAKAEAALSVYS